MNRNLNKYQKELLPIDEKNEWNMGQSSSRRGVSLNEKNENTERNAFEFTGFTKMPKLLFTNKIDNTTRRNTHSPSEYKIEEPISLYNNKPQNENTVSDSIQIVGIPYNSFLVTINEFKNFGYIKDYWFNEESNWMIIKYINPVTAYEALKNYNPYMLDPINRSNRISVTMLPSNADMTNIMSKSIKESKSNEEIKTPEYNTISISSPVSSYWYRVKDVIFNW